MSSYTYVSPQLYQMLAARPPPQNWSSSWPPPVGSGPWPPGFPGPPPPPSGVPVNPQTWSQGQWILNPAFRSAVAGMQPGVQPGAMPPNFPSNLAQWAAPWSHWGVPPGAVPADYNPYKRVPKPADPSYWKTQIKDNGLQLENMHIRNDPPPPPETQDRSARSQSDSQLYAPNTPWTWAPSELHDDSRNPQGPSTSGGVRERRDAQNPQGPSTSGGVQERRDAQNRDRSREPLQPRRHTADEQYHPSSSRPQAHERDHHHVDDPARRHTHGEHSRSSHRPDSSDRGNVSSQQAHVHRRQASEPPQQPRASSSRQPSHSSRHASHHHPETFTARRELQPTFSPNIVRTPDYYRRGSQENPPTRPSSPTESFIPPRGLGNIPESSTMPILPTLTPARAQPLRASNTAPPQPFTSSSSSSAAARAVSNITNTSSFTEEPAGMLSPLVGATPGVTTRPDKIASSSMMARHYSEPPLSHEEVPPIAAPAPPSRNRPTPHPRANPLPPPPQVSPSHTAAAAAAAYRHPEPDAPTPQRVRKGFWNRRGDYLTPDKYIVYAPHERANPRELSTYPRETEGYLDHEGKFERYDPTRPELPESIPLRGQPPRIPYERFVEYMYV